MYWRVFVNYAISGACKYNFTGNKHKLMELIGCLVSSSLERCDVTYTRVSGIDTTIEMIQSGITKDGTILITTWKVK